jgi:hypothetical protein
MNCVAFRHALSFYILVVGFGLYLRPTNYDIRNTCLSYQLFFYYSMSSDEAVY